MLSLHLAQRRRQRRAMPPSAMPLLLLSLSRRLQRLPMTTPTVLSRLPPLRRPSLLLWRLRLRLHRHRLRLRRCHRLPHRSLATPQRSPCRRRLQR